MASIYSNAYLCIAATCASDDMEGFFGEASPYAIRYCAKRPQTGEV
jgi:hypothetical protein